jgi:hypothetical protein
MKLLAIAIVGVAAVASVIYFARPGDAPLAHISQSEQSPAPAVIEPPDDGNSHQLSDAESSGAISAPMVDERKLAGIDLPTTLQTYFESRGLKIAEAWRATQARSRPQTRGHHRHRRRSNRD